MAAVRVSLRALRRAPLATLGSLAGDGPDAVTFRAGPVTIHLATNPELIRDVFAREHKSLEKGRGLRASRRVLGDGLLTSEGEVHRRARRLVQPLFHRKEIARYADIMVAHATRLSASWTDGEAVDMHAEMGQLALAIVAESLFGSSIGTPASRDIARALKVSVDMFGRAALPFGGVVERLPLPSNRRFRAAQRTLDDAIASMIDARRAHPAARYDLLSLLLDAAGEGGDALSDAQVRDEAMTIFLAGHETTALALTWAWYLLADHPEAESRMHAELDDLLDGRAPTVDDTPRLAYTRAVVAEAMRLYPPAWAVGRRALRPMRMGDTSVARGDIVVVSQWVTHRDPRFWPEPDRFLPERFHDGADPARPKFAYFPFGGGPRICIGEHFAWMEAVLVLASLARHWRPRADRAQRIELQPSITLRPRDGLRMQLVGRAGVPHV